MGLRFVAVLLGGIALSACAGEQASDASRADDYDEKKETGIAISAFVLPPPSWEGATH